MFKVYDTPCNNCLLSKDAIVSPKRRQQIIKSCLQKQRHFTCHKATMQGDDICCRTFYDKLGHYSQLIRIAERLNAVETVQQTDTDKLPTYREMTERQKRATDKIDE